MSILKLQKNIIPNLGKIICSVAAEVTVRLFYNSYSTNKHDVKDIKVIFPGGINKPTFATGMGWNTLRSDKK